MQYLSSSNQWKDVVKHTILPCCTLWLMTWNISMELADKTWDRQETRVFLCQDLELCGCPGMSLAYDESGLLSESLRNCSSPSDWICLSVTMCLSLCLPAVACEQLCLQGHIWSVSPRVDLGHMSQVWTGSIVEASYLNQFVEEVTLLLANVFNTSFEKMCGTGIFTSAS